MWIVIAFAFPVCAQLAAIDPALKVPATDERNYTRPAPIAELETLARVLADECGARTDIVPSRDDLARACTLADALADFRATRAVLLADLSGAPEEILAGRIRLREPTRPARDLPPKLRAYLLARRRLELVNRAARAVVQRWWPTKAGDYFRYVHPQAEASLEGALELSSIVRFRAALDCADRGCLQSQSELAAAIRRLTSPVRRHRIRPAAAPESSLAAFSEYSALRRALRLRRLREEFEKATDDPVVLSRGGAVQPPRADRKRVEDALQAWIDELLRVPFLAKDDRREVRADLLAQALEASTVAAPPADITGAAALPSFAERLRQNIDAAASRIVAGGIQWEARTQRIAQ
jgi:hypothetical protein